MIQLSKRLQAVADLITEDGILADIGTDHGYIPIYMIQQKQDKIKGAIAADVRKGPLLRASEHIEQYGLGDYIETRLSDGAKGLLPGEADIFVIAGMGGGLMQRILDQSREVFAQAKEVILQPQSEICQLRHYLVKNHWKIMAEDMVEEEGKYYPMMRALSFSESNGLPYEQGTEMDFLYGAGLLREGHPVLLEFLLREEHIYGELLEELGRIPDNEGIKKRREEISLKRECTRKALERYEVSGSALCSGAAVSKTLCL